MLDPAFVVVAIAQQGWQVLVALQHRLHTSTAFSHSIQSSNEFAFPVLTTHQRSQQAPSEFWVEMRYLDFFHGQDAYKFCLEMWPETASNDVSHLCFGSQNF